MREYVKKNVTKDWLIKNDFKFNRYYSTKEDSIYTYRFSVGESLECELFMFVPDGKVLVNVYKAGTRDKYPAFYFNEYGKWDKILSSIHNKIDTKIKQLGIIDLEASKNKHGRKQKNK